MAMRKAFLEGPGVDGWAFYGTPFNTGDGIEMALRVGAGLMKVGKAASRIIAAVPIRVNGMKMGLHTDSVGAANSLVIDNYGRRYASETLVTIDPSRYFFYKTAIQFDIQKLDYPRTPSWMIFDETLRARQCIIGSAAAPPGSASYRGRRTISTPSTGVGSSRATRSRNSPPKSRRTATTEGS